MDFQVSDELSAVAVDMDVEHSVATDGHSDRDGSGDEGDASRALQEMDGAVNDHSFEDQCAQDCVESAPALPSSVSLLVSLDDMF